MYVRSKYSGVVGRNLLIFAPVMQKLVYIYFCQFIHETSKLLFVSYTIVMFLLSDW